MAIENNIHTHTHIYTAFVLCCCCCLNLKLKNHFSSLIKLNCNFFEFLESLIPFNKHRVKPNHDHHLKQFRINNKYNTMSEETTTINRDNAETKEDLKTSQDAVIVPEKENDLETQSDYDDDYDYDINDNGNNDDDDEEKLFVTDAKKPKETVSSSTSDDDDEENSNSKTDSDVKVSKENGDKEPLVKQESDVKDDEQTATATLDLSQSLEEKKQILSQLHENVDYAIILAFLDKFASHLSLKDLTFATLESYFTATKTIPRKLIDLHLKLMKNLPMGKHAKKDKWDYYLAKFVRRFSAKEAQLIEDSAYLTCDVGFKVNII